jgi:hypothetical protein
MDGKAKLFVGRELFHTTTGSSIQLQHLAFNGSNFIARVEAERMGSITLSIRVVQSCRTH